uniref:uncharacterized protein LOC122583390 n=1 Tax=Erigeron canadensis TaxID=72917 RepID=UPI001CB8B0E9|nr:uncharacterized protein LOC122583390 [Erigeron canadensis]
MAKEFSIRDETQSRRSGSKTVAKVETCEESRLVAEVKALSKQMNERFDSQDARFKSIERDVNVIANGCYYCGDMHYSEDCPDKPTQEVSYVQNQQQGNFNQTTSYQNRQSGTSYPSSSFNTNDSGFGGNRFSRFNNQQNATAELRDIMKDLISAQKATNEKVEEQSNKMHSAWDSMNTRLDGLAHKLDQSTKSAQAMFQDLEAKIERLGNQNRQPGTLPSNTQPNPKPQLNNQGSGPKYTPPNARNEYVHEEEEQVDEEVEMEPNPAVQNPAVPSKQAEKPEVKPYKPIIPFPRRLVKEKLKKHMEKFVSHLSKLHINIPFLDAIVQMPGYAKCLRQILMNKKNLAGVTTTVLEDVCSAAMTCKLPEKRGDPGSFTIPCTIGNLSVKRALNDSGAIINLMPSSIYSKLNLGEPKPIKMKIHLVDKSEIKPIEILEDVLVKVGGLVFPVDFVIIDVDEALDVPLILGRPFLATADANIEVGRGKLTLRAGNESVTFSNTYTVSLPNFVNSVEIACVSSIDLQIDEWLDKELEKKKVELKTTAVPISNPADGPCAKIRKLYSRLKSAVSHGNVKLSEELC